jgi:regulatory protein
MALGGTRRRAAQTELRAGTVTALIAKGDHGQRVAVHVEGELAFELAREVAARAGLCQGQFLTEERQASLLEDNQPHDSRERAVSFLSRRELSRHEVGVRLGRAGFQDAVVGETLLWLEERGYVDDRRFAAAYARERLKAGWGRHRIISELLKKGIRRELVAGEAWNGLIAEEERQEEIEAVLSLARRRFYGQMATDPTGTKRRLGAFLARRGHDWDTIERVIREFGDEAVGEQDAASDPPQ